MIFRFISVCMIDDVFSLDFCVMTYEDSEDEIEGVLAIDISRNSLYIHFMCIDLLNIEF